MAKEPKIQQPIPEAAPLVANAPQGGPTPGARPLDHEIQGGDKIKHLVAVIPADTPDGHCFYGYAGYRITYADLKLIAADYE